MLNLNDIEKEKISRIIKDSFDEYYNKYQSSKYPEKPYVEWKETFHNPKNVRPENIKQALEWKYGHWGKQNYPLRHKIIISKIQDNWIEFVEIGNFEVNSTFSFWRRKLNEHQNFITIAYLTHLIHNSSIEIIDQHNFRAMNYLISTARPSWIWKEKPSEINDLIDYSEFFKTLLPSLDFDGDKIRKLDKFLMMFGKHKVKEIENSILNEVVNRENIREQNPQKPKSANPLSLTYRGKTFDDFELAASKVVANVTKEKLIEVLKKIYGVWIKKENGIGFFVHDDCRNICNNYRDFQNLLYQLGFLDKKGRGQYVMTFEGEKVAEGESFCKYFPQSLLGLAKAEKEEDKHALLLLWFYYHASLNTGNNPGIEYFQKKNKANSYPIIRKQVGKTIMDLLSSCFQNNRELIQEFFDKWEELLILNKT